MPLTLLILKYIGQISDWDSNGEREREREREREIEQTIIRQGPHILMIPRMLKEKVKIKVLDWSLCVGRPPDLLCSWDEIINLGFELFIFLFNRKVQVYTLIREP